MVAALPETGHRYRPRFSDYLSSPSPDSITGAYFTPSSLFTRLNSPNHAPRPSPPLSYVLNTTTAEMVENIADYGWYPDRTTYLPDADERFLGDYGARRAKQRLHAWKTAGVFDDYFERARDNGRFHVPFSESAYMKNSWLWNDTDETVFASPFEPEYPYLPFALAPPPHLFDDVSILWAPLLIGDIYSFNEETCRLRADVVSLLHKSFFFFTQAAETERAEFNRVVPPHVAPPLGPLPAWLDDFEFDLCRQARPLSDHLLIYLHLIRELRVLVAYCHYSHLVRERLAVCAFNSADPSPALVQNVIGVRYTSDLPADRLAFYMWLGVPVLGLETHCGGLYCVKTYNRDYYRNWWINEQVKKGVPVWTATKKVDSVPWRDPSARDNKGIASATRPSAGTRYLNHTTSASVPDPLGPLARNLGRLTLLQRMR